MIVFGSRGSDLALTQSRQVAEQLKARTGVDYRIEVLETRGDRELDKPLPEIGGKGLFTAELEAALREKRIDVAVHSLKDLPVEDDSDLMLGAVPERADPRDVLIYDPAAEDVEGGSVPLREDATLGTSSPRRRGALLCLKPLLNLVDLRGNVPTRIQRVAEGRLHGTLLAAAGLARLELGEVDLTKAGLDKLQRQPLDPSRVPPAPGQGALAVQCRTDDAATRAALASIEHGPTRTCARAERAVLAALGGGCSMPFGALAELFEGDGARMRAGLFTDVEATVAGGVFVDECAGDVAGATERTIAALAPFAGNPLAGKRIAVLRPAGGDGRLDGGLRVAGATLEGITTADIEPVFPDVDTMRAGLGDGILVFTSARGVDRFCEIAAFEQGLREAVGRVYAVGRATADAALARGLPDVRCPSEGSGGAALVEFLTSEQDAPKAGCRVLHVGAADPHPALGDGLARAGLKVTQTPVYRVVPFDEVDAPREPVHAMVFTSPNSVRAWAATHSGLATGAGSAIAIGPSTEQALREAGMPIGHALTTTGPSELVAAVRELLGA